MDFQCACSSIRAMLNWSTRFSLFMALLGSLLLHLGIIGSLWLGEHIDREHPSIEEVPIALDIKEESDAGKALRQKGHKVSGEPQKLRLKDVLPTRRFAPSGTSERVGSVSQFNGANQGSEGDSKEWGMGMGLEQSVRANPFMSEVAGRVFEHLSYPEDFVRSRIWGQVKARIELDRRGVFIGKFIDLEGGSDLLTAHVGATLISALNDPIHKKSWMTKETIYPVDLTFNFEIYSDDSARPKDQSFYFKNVIHAHRAAYAPPLLNQKIEEWMTHYVPPVVPLPGGVYIDFVRAYRLIKNLAEPSESESRERRLNLLKERLHSALQKKS